VVYKLDVDKQGIFHHAGTMEMLDSNDDAALDKEWDRFKGDNVRVFVFIVDWWYSCLCVANVRCQSKGSICGEYDGSCLAHAWWKVS